MAGAGNETLGSRTGGLSTHRARPSDFHTGRIRALWCLAGFISLLFVSRPVPAHLPQLILPESHLPVGSLAVVVNDRDTLSLDIGSYYQQRRNVPSQNVIHVAFEPHRDNLPPHEFSELKSQLDARTPPYIQAYALTWARPYRVGCMSITTAFAAGFDRRWCSQKRCAPTRRNPLYNALTHRPFDDAHLRPTIAIAARDLVQARALIDRGIASDGTQPPGTAYLMSTSDKARNVRAGLFPRIKEIFGTSLKTDIISADTLRNRDDVLFYFTGLAKVSDLESLAFRPGAIADHLTSAGGQLTDSAQMSSLAWLEAGATGSYGTVTEPCNLTGKFPNPALVIGYYLQGNTLLEAYWKSVAMPGEGIFIGEPLAAPFSGYRLSERNDAYLLETYTLAPGAYRLETAQSPVGPYRPEPYILRVAPGQTRFQLPKLERPGYRLVPLHIPPS